MCSVCFLFCCLFSWPGGPSCYMGALVFSGRLAETTKLLWGNIDKALTSNCVFIAPDWVYSADEIYKAIMKNWTQRNLDKNYSQSPSHGTLPYQLFCHQARIKEILFWKWDCKYRGFSKHEESFCSMSQVHVSYRQENRYKAL